MKSVRSGRGRFDESKLTLVICTVVVFLAQISDKGNTNTMMLLGYAIALIWAFFCSSSMLMAMILFFLSDNSILDVGGISIQLIIMCIYLVRFSILKKKKIFGKTLLAGLVISAYSFIYIDLGFGYVLQGVKLAMMILFLTEYFCEPQALSKKNYEQQLSFAVFGVFLSVVAAICVNPFILLSARIALSEESNWNLLGILSALLFSHCFVMCFVDKRNGVKYILFSFLMAGCALLSTSRTALLIAVIGIIWTLLFINGHGTFARKVLVFVVIVIFVSLIANGTIQISFVDKLIDRIVNPRRGDISNGRFDLWSGYVRYLQSNPKVLWFGYGKTLIEGITTSTSTASNMAHNMFVEQLTMYGIVGSAVVVWIYGISIKKIMHGSISGNQMKFFINVLLVFVAGMFSHVITSVLVTMELYIGIMQYLVLSTREKNE